MKYFKYNALGNSFILIASEDTDKSFLTDKSKIERILSTDRGIGADGLLIINHNENKIDFYNSDGSEALFCGNGIRAYFAYYYTFVNKNKNEFIKVNFGNLIYSGKVLKEIDSNNYIVTVKVKNNKPQIKEIIYDNNELKLFGYLTTIGVEHYVVMRKDNVEIFEKLQKNENLLQQIQLSTMFSDVPNIDLVDNIDETNIKLSTYERGVGYTASCGSGSIAAAYVSSATNEEKNNKNNYKILTKYGKNRVSISNSNFILTGTITLVAVGEYYG